MADLNDIISELYKSLHKFDRYRFSLLFKRKCQYNTTLKVLNACLKINNGKDNVGIGLILDDMILRNRNFMKKDLNHIELYSCFPGTFIERQKIKREVKTLNLEYSVLIYWLNKLKP